MNEIGGVTLPHLQLGWRPPVPPFAFIQHSFLQPLYTI